LREYSVVGIRSVNS